MSHKLGREGFKQLIAEDIAWLLDQPRTLEREHILLALSQMEKFHYDLPELLQEVVRTYPIQNTRGDPIGSPEGVQAWIDWLEGDHDD